MTTRHTRLTTHTSLLPAMLRLLLVLLLQVTGIRSEHQHTSHIGTTSAVLQNNGLLLVTEGKSVRTLSVCLMVSTAQRDTV